MTTIEWTRRPGTTGETWNPIRARSRATGKVGHWCVRVNDACRHCYACTMNRWRGAGVDYAAQARAQVELFLDDGDGTAGGGPPKGGALAAPLRWRSPRTIFVCSMTDLFGDWVVDAWLDRLFAVMALTPRHTYLVLTKRPARMRAYFAGDAERRSARASIALSPLSGGAGRHPQHIQAEATQGWASWPLPNVWLGATVHDQASANDFIPELLATPAAKRFVSYEPALGPVDLGKFLGETPCPSRDDATHCVHWYDDGAPCCACGQDRGLDWVICGGESGPSARPMHPDWARGARDQCAAAGVPFFFKQWGMFVPGPASQTHFVARDGRTPSRRRPTAYRLHPTIRASGGCCEQRMGQRWTDRRGRSRGTATSLGDRARRAGLERAAHDRRRAAPDRGAAAEFGPRRIAFVRARRAAGWRATRSGGRRGKSMKALSLTQPWASLVACGIKAFETRSWHTEYRGALAIHATAARVLGPDDMTAALARICARGFGAEWHLVLPRGAVLAIVHLVDVRPAAAVARGLDGVEAACGDFSPGRWAWRLAAVDKLPRPIPARGFQGLWDWDEADPEGERRSSHAEAARQGSLF